MPSGDGEPTRAKNNPFLIQRCEGTTKDHEIIEEEKRSKGRTPMNKQVNVPTDPRRSRKKIEGHRT